jgi:hypothetical protein
VSVIETPESRRVEDTQHEGSAVAWLTLGLVLGQLGASIGVYLVLRSTRWSARWKAAAIALPAVWVVCLKVYPQDAEAWVSALCGIVVIALVIWAAHVLVQAASRGSGHGSMTRIGAFAVAALVLAALPDVMDRLHPIGSYDLTADVVAAAESADAAGEVYGVISEENGWINGGGPSRAQAERLAGPGNARFVPLYDRLAAGDGEMAHLSAEELGTCYVFPVVTSVDDGIESVTALTRFCVGTSEAGSYVSLTDR